MRRLGDARLVDPEADFGTEIAELSGEVADYVSKLVSVFPESAYPGNVFKNQTRTISFSKMRGLLPDEHSILDVDHVVGDPPNGASIAMDSGPRSCQLVCLLEQVRQK